MSDASGSKKQMIEGAAKAASDAALQRPPRAVEARPAALPTRTSGIPATRPQAPAAAPLIIVLPAELNNQMQALWQQSFPDGRSQQQGGVIVREVSGQESLVNISRHCSCMFRADRQIKPEHKLVGLFHTRPFDRSEGGQVNVSLSGGDAGYLFNHADDVVIAQSGESQFMYLRTEATSKSVDAAKIHAQHEARIRQLLNQGLRFDEASRIAARELAADHGLAYYEGKAGELGRVAAY